MKAPMLRHDLANHFIYGSFVFSITAAISLLVLGSKYMLVSLFVGAFVTCVVAVGKELRDYISKQGTPDTGDIVATVAGAIPPAIILILVHFLLI